MQPFSEIFRSWEKGRLIIRRKEKRMYIRGDVSDSGGQRAVGERKTEGERNRSGRDSGCSKRGCLTLVGKEVQKREDKEMNLFSIPIRHTELIFLT